MLTPLGFTVLEAPDGMTSLALISRAHPDLILMDIAMPHIDGWQTVRQLRQHGFHGPIVMLSANARESQVESLSEGLHNDYLIKPFKQGALLDTLARQLQLKWHHHSPSSPSSAQTHLTPPVHIDAVLREELVSLVEIGHISGLRNSLKDAQNHGRISTSSMTALESALDRFDFHQVMHLLEKLP